MATKLVPQKVVTYTNAVAADVAAKVSLVSAANNVGVAYESSPVNSPNDVVLQAINTFQQTLNATLLTQTQIQANVSLLTTTSAATYAPLNSPSLFGNTSIAGNTTITGNTSIVGNTTITGNVLAVTADTMSVNASISLLKAVSANGSNGSAGQFLTSAGSGNTYWSTLTLPATPTLNSVLAAGSTSSSPIGVGNTSITGFANITGHTIIGPIAGSTTTGNQTSLEVRNNGGTGDDNVAAISYHCTGQFGVHQHLRADGYFGVGGWSATNWRWYLNTGNGDMTAAGNVTAYSDPRLKEDITPIESALSKVMGWNGVKYRWKQSSVIGRPGEYDYGILSPDIEKTAPELVVDSLWKSPDGDFYKTVAYDKLAPFLIEAIKEQQKQIEELKTQVIALQQAIK